jgi:hypothetical protein
MLTLLEESLKTMGTSDPFVVCSTMDKFAKQSALKEKIP